MASSNESLESTNRVEPVLAHLPVSRLTNYGKGQVIYNPYDLPTHLYRVVTGLVGISQIAGEGRQILLEIVRPDELFGESAFAGAPGRSQRATALQDAEVMAWTVSDMELLVLERPRLGVALLQLLAQRNAEFTRRIESLSIDSIDRRLARSLLRFSERLGSPEEDGAVRMMPFTHEMLSRYVGTSREIVTLYMNRFRKRGYVSYSRDGIRVYGDTLKTWLDGSGYPSSETPS